MLLHSLPLFFAFRRVQHLLGVGMLLALFRQLLSQIVVRFGQHFADFLLLCELTFLFYELTVLL